MSKFTTKVSMMAFLLFIPPASFAEPVTLDEQAELLAELYLRDGDIPSGPSDSERFDSSDDIESCFCEATGGEHVLLDLCPDTAKVCSGVQECLVYTGQGAVYKKSCSKIEF